MVHIILTLTHQLTVNKKILIMNSYCLFNRQLSTTLIMSYRTQTWGWNGVSGSIYYRINEGPWQTINNIQSYLGPDSYFAILNTPVNINDKVDYYFTDTLGSLSYNLGFNGGFFGGIGVNTTIISPGINYIYFNICSQGDVANITFCYNPPY